MTTTTTPTPTTTTTTTTADVATDLCVRWTALWNGDPDVADDLLTGGARLHLAGPSAATVDGLRGPEALARFVTAFRADRPGLRYRMDGPPVAGTDTVAFRWLVDRVVDGVPTAARSGIDVLRIADGRIAEVWSVTGDRAFSR